MTATTTILLAALALAQVPAPTAPLSPAAVAQPTATASLSPADRPASAHHTPLLRRARTLNLTGLVLLAVTSPLWGTMAAGLHGGAQDARAYNDLVAEANRGPRPLTAEERASADIHARSGPRMNRLALAAGITAGALTVIAAALLGRAHVLRRTARRLEPLALTRGLGLGWHMQF